MTRERIHSALVVAILFALACAFFWATTDPRPGRQNPEPSEISLPPGILL